MRFDYGTTLQGQVRVTHEKCGRPMLGVDETDPRSFQKSTFPDETFCDCHDGDNSDYGIQLWGEVEL